MGRIGRTLSSGSDEGEEILIVFGLRLRSQFGTMDNGQ
jgi:hypothetical protein